ncbi:unnamed protein product [Closterium sp. NIES-65]|nr:unnamed protein product [Closterium sp. NIES-65]
MPTASSCPLPPHAHCLPMPTASPCPLPPHAHCLPMPTASPCPLPPHAHAHLLAQTPLWPAASFIPRNALHETLHESDTPARGMLTRAHFFFLITALSFCWYLVPGYLIPIVSCLSWVCWVWPASITAQQLGSGGGFVSLLLDLPIYSPLPLPPLFWVCWLWPSSITAQQLGSGGCLAVVPLRPASFPPPSLPPPTPFLPSPGSAGSGLPLSPHSSSAQVNSSSPILPLLSPFLPPRTGWVLLSSVTAQQLGSDGCFVSCLTLPHSPLPPVSPLPPISLRRSRSPFLVPVLPLSAPESPHHNPPTPPPPLHASSLVPLLSPLLTPVSALPASGFSSLILCLPITPSPPSVSPPPYSPGPRGMGLGAAVTLDWATMAAFLSSRLAAHFTSHFLRVFCPTTSPHPFHPALPGLRGMGLGAITLDWATMSAFLASPLAAPWFAILNVGIGFALFVYVLIPICYWGNVFAATRFPFLSSGTYQWSGDRYPVQAIITPDFRLNETMYTEQNLAPYISVFFALCYGLGFAALTATVVHVALWYGPEIYQRTMSAGALVLAPAAPHAARQDLESSCQPSQPVRFPPLSFQSLSATEVKPDVHTRLMQRYPKVPWWWFLLLLLANIAVCIAFLELNAYFQLPWWGLLLSAALSLFFTLPIGIVTATTNQQPGLNIITEMIWGYIRPGEPIGNVCFKTYGYISMTQAIAFLQDFKLGHYMKIPPQAMFVVQVFATILAGFVNLGTSWWLYDTVENGLICKINDENFPENSPWTCPTANVFYSASIIWGLIGPERMFGPTAFYNNLNWWFLGGALAPIPFWAAHKMWPRQVWLTKVHIPVMLTGVGMMPPASPINYLGWLTMGFIFNKLIFTYRKVRLKPLQFPSPGGVLV